MVQILLFTLVSSSTHAVLILQTNVVAAQAGGPRGLRKLLMINKVLPSICHLSMTQNGL